MKGLHFQRDKHNYFISIHTPTWEQTKQLQKITKILTKLKANKASKVIASTDIKLPYENGLGFLTA